MKRYNLQFGRSTISIIRPISELSQSRNDRCLSNLIWTPLLHGHTLILYDRHREVNELDPGRTMVDPDLVPTKNLCVVSGSGIDLKQIIR